jgi:hypothetical protein
MYDKYGIKTKTKIKSQVISHQQRQSPSVYTKLCIVNDVLRSFGLENNHKNLEEKEGIPFDCLLQSSAWLSSYKKHLSHKATGTPCEIVIGRDMIHNITFRENWDQIQKIKQDMINKSNKKQESKSL